jgi:hypothetical protein
VPTKLLCPICHAEENSNGEPFCSEWAVATHVAGKILHSDDRLHESWARQKVLNLNEGTVPKLADSLLWPLRQEMAALQEQFQRVTPWAVVGRTEILTHRHIKRRLQEKYGDVGETWWVEGVPKQIRRECVARREEDSQRGDPYNYTYILDLQAILDKTWVLFEDDFERVGRKVSSKREFLEEIRILNDIRNRYAHPVRAPETGSYDYMRDLEMSLKIWTVMVVFCGAAV